MKRNKGSGSTDQGQCNLYYGTVTAVDEQAGRARVRIDDLDGLETFWLNILQSRVKEDQEAYWLDVGDFVAVMSDEKGEQGVILGCLYTDANPPPITTKNKYYRRFSDGSFIEFDRSTGVLTLEVTDRINIVAPNGTHFVNDTSESTINSKNIAVMGARDDDDESSGSDVIVDDNQI